MFAHPQQLAAFLAFACHHSTGSAWDEREHWARSLGIDFQAAAVLMPFEWTNTGARVWLTRRSDTLRHHGGQIAFPGGKRDRGDADARATALRETAEELGAAPQSWHIVGQLRDCYLPSGFVVSPVVALRHDTQPWHPNRHEVAAVFAVPLAEVLDGRRYRLRQVEHQHRLFTVYSLPHGEYDIWGATAAMLYHLAEAYAHWRPVPQEHFHR